MKYCQMMKAHTDKYETILIDLRSHFDTFENEIKWIQLIEIDGSIQEYQNYVELNDHSFSKMDC